MDDDALELKKLGYVQELLRDMGGFSSFAISFSVISILTGATQLYGYGLSHGGPFQITAGWWLVSIFTMCVAMSMAELASSYPTAGALYHWSSFLGGRAMGWFTACFNTVGQFAILAGIDYGLAQFIVGICHWQSGPLVINSLYGLILLSHAILNHFGIRIVTWLNDFSAWYHIIVVVFLLVALTYVGLVQPPSFLLKFSSNDGFHPGYSFIIGLLLAQWTLTGYDASAHVTEETHDPRRNAPWGIFLAVFVSVVVGSLMLSITTLSIPSLEQVASFGDSAFTELLSLRLGPQLGVLLSSLIAGAMWLCGLASLTSASRMVYAFSRDGGLPYSKIWKKINSKHRTPSHAIWGLSIIALILAVSVQLYSAVVSIATIALYVSYGLPILARLLFRYKNPKKDILGPWNLGKFSNLNSVVALVWIIFVTVVFVLPPNQMAGFVMGGILILFLAIWFIRAREHFPGPKFHL